MQFHIINMAMLLAWFALTVPVIGLDGHVASNIIPCVSGSLCKVTPIMRVTSRSCEAMQSLLVSMFGSQVPLAATSCSVRTSSLCLLGVRSCVSHAAD